MFVKLFKKKSLRSDEELIEAYKKTRNNELVGELFERYTHLVYGVCLKYLKNEEDSKDAVILIFEKLLRELLRFEIEHFPSWLHRLTQNYCLMYLRQHQREYKKSKVYLSFYQDELMESEKDWHLDNRSDKEQQLTAIENALTALSPEQQACIDLFFLQEKTYQEVSQITGFSLKEVKSYLQNGKRNIKKKLGLLSLVGMLIMFNYLFF